MRGFARRCEGVCSGARVRMHKSSAQNVCTVKFREGCRTSNGQRKQGPTSTGTGVVGAPTRIPYSGQIACSTTPKYGVVKILQSPRDYLLILGNCAQSPTDITTTA